MTERKVKMGMLLKMIQIPSCVRELHFPFSQSNGLPGKRQSIIPNTAGLAPWTKSVFISVWKYPQISVSYREYRVRKYSWDQAPQKRPFYWNRPMFFRGSQPWSWSVLDCSIFPFHLSLISRVWWVMKSLSVNIQSLNSELPSTSSTRSLVFIKPNTNPTI